ncbi:MAG: hypothetical protein AAB426_06585, partial [Myxococcota bacterium]
MLASFRNPFARLRCCALPLTLVAASPALAEPPPRVLALFVTAQSGVPNAVVKKLTRSIVNLSTTLPEVSLVAPKRLRARLGRDPGARVAACGSNLQCIARVGGEVQAAEVLYGRIKAKGPALMVQFIVVGVASATIERRAAFNARTTAELEDLVRAGAKDLLG